MAPHATKLVGMSRRAYARRRGCNEATVRQRIADGTISKAVLPDGSIAAKLADRLWRTATTRGEVAGDGTLSQARLRKAVASTLALAAEIEAMEQQQLPRNEVEALVPQLLAVVRHASRHIIEAARTVVGVPPAQAFSILTA